MKIKRFIAVMISVLIALSSMPVTAFADESLPAYVGVDSTDYTFARFDDGTSCNGENPICSWSYDADTKTLVIDGSAINGTTSRHEVYDGVMGTYYDYHLPAFVIEDGETPIIRYCPDDVKHLVFSANVRCIGYTRVCDDVFPNITEVTFAAGSRLASIESYVFRDSHITDISIPDTVSLIGGSCFMNSDIEHFNIPSAMTVIQSNTFNSCKNIRSVDLSGTNITYIASRAFNDCENLSTVVLNDKITYLSGFSNCPSLSSFTIPDSVRTIGAGAFSGSILGSVTIPEGVTTIEDNAFYRADCSVAPFPSTLRTVGFQAFTQSTITDIDFSRVTDEINFDERAFSFCKNLVNVVLSPNMTAVNDRMFMGCDITRVTIPASVRLIDKYAFSDAHIGNITFEKNSALDEIGEGAFSGATVSSDLVIPNGCQTLDRYAFADSTISAVDIPSSVTEIGSCPFSDADVDTIIVRSARPSLVGDPFSGIVSANNTVVGYRGTDVYRYAISNNLRFVELSDYSTDVPIPDDNTDKSSYGTWSGGTWVFDTDKKILSVSGTGALTRGMTTAAGTTLQFVDYAVANGVDMVIIGEGITSVPDYYLYNIDSYPLHCVRLPSTLKSIGMYAFKGPDIIDVRLPDGLQSIGKYAFAGCGFSSLVLPDSVTTVGEYAFSGCSDLSDVTLSASIAEIPEGAFYSTGIGEITIPDSVQNIGKKAFGDCRSMTLVHIPNPDTTIYTDSANKINNAIGYDSDGNRITHFVDVGKSVNQVSYGYYSEVVIDAPFDSNAYNYAEFASLAYDNNYDTADKDGKLDMLSHSRWMYYSDSKILYIICSDFGNNRYQSGKHTNVFFSTDESGDLLNNDGTPADDMEVRRVVFCPGVHNIMRNIRDIAPEYITLPSTLESILSFADCDSLKTVSIPSGASVGAHAFDGCDSLVSVRLGKSIGDYAFANCASLKTIDFGCVSYVSKYAFYNCGSISELVIGDPVRTIGDHAFDKCVGVKRIVLNDGPEEVGKYAFANCPFLAEVVMNCTTLSDYDRISYYAYDHSGFSTTGVDLVIGDNVTKADLYCFEGMNIANIHIGRNVTDFTISEEWRSLRGFTVDENNRYFTVYSNCLYKDTTLVCVPPAYTSVTVRSDTTEIGYGAFMASNIVSLTLPSKVKKIGDGAFSGCEKLKHINLDDALRTVGNYAFSDCTRLRSISFPSMVNSIGYGCFENCSSLASVILPNWITRIREYTFAYCRSLTTIIIPELVTTVEEGAFYECRCLTKVLSYKNASFTERNIFCSVPRSQLTFYTVAGSGALEYATANNYHYVKYASRSAFKTFCDEMLDAEEGYLGYCTDGHGDIEYLTVYENDCENDGYIIGVCEYCSEILEEIHTPATGHNFVKTVDTPPTATTVGVRKYTCTRCHDSYAEYTDPVDSSLVSQRYTVSGSVVIANSVSADTGVTPVRSADVVIDDLVVATTGDDGGFSFTLATGSYTAEIRYPYGYTRYVTIVVDDADVTADPIAIVAVDFNRDGRVDDADVEMFDLVVSSKRNDPAYLDFVDVNNDGYINAWDYLIIKQFYGTDSSTFAYPPLTLQKQ